jgi:uncharacterized protein (TIGR02001 family)
MLRAALAALGLSMAAPAAAQVGAALSVYSDAQFRGYSLSGYRPIATLDLSYDDPSGAYASLSGSVVAADGVRPFSVQLGGGYAHRLASGTTLDFGVVHSAYHHYSHDIRSSSYTEIYAGIARGSLSSRLSFSPLYFRSGEWTLYGEVNGNFPLSPRLRLTGHLGLLVPVRTRRYASSRAEHDWRLGVAHDLGRFTLHAYVSGGGPARDFYRGKEHSRTRLVVGASYAL